MRALRAFFLAGAWCAGISPRLSVVHPEIVVIGLMPRQGRPRLGRIGQTCA